MWKWKTNVSQEEAVPESLKNILLVMADGDYLLPPSGDEKASVIWMETKKRVDRFLPDLFPDIFPKANPPPVTAPTAQKLEESPIPPAEANKEKTNDPPAPGVPVENNRK